MWLFPLPSSHAVTPVLALYNVPPGQYGFAKKLSLNTVVIWADRERLDEAHKLGLQALVNVWPGNFPDSAAWRKRILELKSHPAIFAWCLYDEPDLNRKPIEEVAAAYRTIKSLDPAHPVYQTVWNPLRYADYAPYCDIFAVVPYIVTKKEPLNDMDYVRVHHSVAMAKKVMRGKPVYTVVQSFAGLPAWPRPPTPRELSTMLAVSKAAGSEGFAFYAYTSNEPYPTMESQTHYALMNDTPLMNAIRSAGAALK